MDKPTLVSKQTLWNRELMARSVGIRRALEGPEVLPEVASHLLRPIPGLLDMMQSQLDFWRGFPGASMVLHSGGPEGHQKIDPRLRARFDGQPPVILAEQVTNTQIQPRELVNPNLIIRVEEPSVEAPGNDLVKEHVATWYSIPLGEVRVNLLTVV